MKRNEKEMTNKFSVQTLFLKRKRFPLYQNFALTKKEGREGGEVEPQASLSFVACHGCTCTRMTRRCEFYISVVCFVSRVCIPHAQRWFFFCNSYCCSLDLFCSRFEIGVGHLLQERISSVGCSPNQLHWYKNVWKRGSRSSTTEDEVTVATMKKMTWPWRRFIWEVADRENAPPEMSFVMMLVCWMMWRLCCRRQRPEEERSPIHTIRKGVNSSQRAFGGELS